MYFNLNCQIIYIYGVTAGQQNGDLITSIQLLVEEKKNIYKAEKKLVMPRSEKFSFLVSSRLDQTREEFSLEKRFETSHSYTSLKTK